MKKEIIAIALVATLAVSVLAVFVGNQQIQINDIENTATFEANLDYCKGILISASPYSLADQDRAYNEYMECMTQTVNLYDDDEVSAWWANELRMIELEESLALDRYYEQSGTCNNYSFGC
jgi:hypothetical protein